MTEKIIYANYTEAEFKKLLFEAVSQCLSKTDTQKDILPSKDETWFKRKEAASYLNISLPTLDKYTKQYDIPVHRIGRQLRYKKISLDQAISKHQIKYRIK